VPTRILLADDHPLALLSTRTAFQDSEFQVVGEARNGSQVLPLIGQVDPDLVLLDLAMPGIDGIRLLELIAKRHPDLTVVVFSGCDDPEKVELALRLGARGYLLKTLAITELPALLRELLSNAVFHAPPAWAARAQNEAARDAGLSPKELEVLQALAEGLSNPEIAKRLWMSRETVKSHLSHIYRKLNASSRTAAARIAYERHLLDDLSPGRRPQNASAFDRLGSSQAGTACA
jgi:DNA-binding NarL/FixJ family response regulator